MLDYSSLNIYSIRLLYNQSKLMKYEISCYHIFYIYYVQCWILDQLAWLCITKFTVWYNSCHIFSVMEFLKEIKKEKKKKVISISTLGCEFLTTHCI